MLDARSYLCVYVWCYCPCYNYDNKKTGKEELVLTIRQMLDDQKKDIRFMLEDQTNDIKQMLGKHPGNAGERSRKKAVEDSYFGERETTNDESGCYARCA